VNEGGRKVSGKTKILKLKKDKWSTGGSILQLTPIITFCIVVVCIWLVDAQKNDGNPEKCCRYSFQTVVSDEMRLTNLLLQTVGWRTELLVRFPRTRLLPLSKTLNLSAHSIEVK
jgi:hypothetical protein